MKRWVCDDLEGPPWPLPCCWIMGSLYRGIPSLPQPLAANNCHQHLLWAVSGPAQPDLEPERGSLDWAELSFLTPLKWLRAALQIPTSLGSCWRADHLPAFPFQPEGPVAVQVSGTDSGFLGTFLGSLRW